MIRPKRAVEPLLCLIAVVLVSCLPKPAPDPVGSLDAAAPGDASAWTAPLQRLAAPQATKARLAEQVSSLGPIRCEMYEAEIMLPRGWHLNYVGNDPCKTYDIFLPGFEQPVGRYVSCLPDTRASPVGTMGTAESYAMYRKIKVDDAVIEIGVWGVSKSGLSGELQVERIARGRAVATRGVLNFHLRSKQLNELVQALLSAPLRAVSLADLFGEARLAFHDRCALWDAPARGATVLRQWQGIDINPASSPPAGAVRKWTPRPSP
jgi:hypothetical protein